MSSSVVMSPRTAPLVAISRSRRRMILPERVLGSASVKRISSGRASAPISLTTCSPSAFFSSALRRHAALERHEGDDRLPLQLVAAADHRRLGDAGVQTSALSISAVPRRWPATLSTSSMRPMTQK